ncbi:MAG TPA: hypothetical protein VKB18_00680 [Gemmatimonadota bacterium]|nr:hypothetical protein [Gemmatimonadota bacterium]
MRLEHAPRIDPAPRTATAALLLAAAVALAVPGPAAAQEVSYSGSLQYATGDYLFTERTNSVYLFTSLAVQAGRVTISGSLPLIYQSTPWISYSTGGGIPTGGPQQGEVGDSLQRRGGGGGPMSMASRADLAAALGSGRMPASAAAPRPAVRPAAAMQPIALPDTASFDEFGAGDPTFRAAVDLVEPGTGHVTVTLAGEVKAPIADPASGFGTGEWDGGGLLSVGGRLGSTFLFGEVGYWVLGDMPDLQLQNPVSYSVGVGRRIGNGDLAVLASLSGYTRILAETDPPLDVGGGLSYRLADGRSLSLGVSVGLSESSPDLSLSVGWRTRL